MIRKVLHGKKPVKVWTDDIDQNTEVQLLNTASLPFIHKHVAAMPDVHLGLGATVGSVVATRRAVIPAAVGVDIGCGMLAVKIGLRPDEVPHNRLREAIEGAVPVGFNRHNDIPDFIRPVVEGDVAPSFSELCERHGVRDELWTQKNIDALLKQSGTLGGGNHFIELCTDESDSVWLMLHSGSRGIGNRIGQYFIERAKELMERYFIELPDPDLSYLPEGTPLFDAYWDFLSWAQNYAQTNRNHMVRLITSALSYAIGRPLSVDEMMVHCHHNYATREHHFGQNVIVTRKGAVSARDGELGIIPGSMGARSYIVRGKGNPESFHSCSHGAGRRMSRKAARKQYTEHDLADMTAGVECRKDSGVVDEIPAAYKDIDEVMANQSDLVEPVHTLKQFVCVKG